MSRVYIVEVETAGREVYRIEADSEEEAVSVVRSGELPDPDVSEVSSIEGIQSVREAVQ